MQKIWYCDDHTSSHLSFKQDSYHADDGYKRLIDVTW